MMKSENIQDYIRLDSIIQQDYPIAEHSEKSVTSRFCKGKDGGGDCGDCGDCGAVVLVAVLRHRVARYGVFVGGSRAIDWRT